MSEQLPICIICDQPHIKETIEHIIPQSLGNQHYVLRRGLVCFNCNHRFAKHEHMVVSSPSFIQTRKNHGIIINDDKFNPTKLTQESLSFFLHKVAFESLYKSRRSITEKFDFRMCKHYLSGRLDKEDREVKQKTLTRGKSIPSFYHRWLLRRHGIRLSYAVEFNKVLFCFQYDSISFTIVVN